MDVIERLLHEISWRFPKGYINIEDKEDKALLHKILKEEYNIILNEEVPNKSQTIKAVKKIVDTVGSKHGLFAGKSKPNRLGLPGKKDSQFFIDIFKEVFDEDIDIKVIPPRKSPNPSNSFNLYQFTTDEFGEVNIIVSSQPPGGAGKKNEADFLGNINSLIEEAGGTATIKITSPEYTETFNNITNAKDSSLAGAGIGDKSDAQLLSGNEVIANISLKQDGGFRWASVASLYKDFITKLISKAQNGEIKDFELKENPNNPGKFLMYNPNTGERWSKVIIPDFPREDEDKWAFGPEEPKVIIVSKTWSSDDFELEGDTITAKASHIYKSLEDLAKSGMDPVFAIMQHVGTSTGLDFRILPSKQTKGAKERRIALSYDNIMS